MLARLQGFDVFVSDKKLISPQHKKELEELGVDYEEGVHSLEKILSADIVVKSPGIPEKNEVVQLIREKRIELISEIEFAYQYKGNSKIVAITGSNGKTTTTAMAAHIFKTAGMDSAAVGNIGFSFARQVATNPKEIYIIEVSSFQLDDIKTFRPDIAVLTNITEDHLDRYEYQFENYIKSKFSIIKNQQAGDLFIYNEDDEITIKYLKRFLNEVKPVPISMSNQLPEGAYIVNEQMHIKWLQEEMTMSVNDFTVKGRHNQYNTMAAGLLSTAMGIRKESIREAVKTFESLDHRMSTVATIKGVEFINDSKATNTNSTWYALESMTKPTILILGGVDKGNNYAFMKELVQEKVKAIICMGVNNARIHEAFGDIIQTIVDTGSAIEAVRISFELAEKGDVVLLSPACASFDLFKNYEDRGMQFIQAVKNL